MRFSAILTVVLLVSSAGLGAVQAADPLTFDATPAEVNNSTLTETEYELQQQRTETVTREINLFTATVPVAVNNQLTQYRKTDTAVDRSERAATRFVTLTSPEVRIAGRSFNPIRQMSNREIAQRLSNDLQRLEVGDPVGNRTDTVLGTETVVGKFEGHARARGNWTDVYVHVTKVRHGDDYVLALGIYPQDSSPEEARVFRMMNGIEHDGEGDV